MPAKYSVDLSLPPLLLPTSSPTSSSAIIQAKSLSSGINKAVRTENPCLRSQIIPCDGN